MPGMPAPQMMMMAGMGMSGPVQMAPRSEPLHGSTTLSRTQLGELELAKARADKVVAARRAAAPKKGRKRRGGDSDASDEDYDDDGDPDYDLSRMSAEEADKYIAAKIAAGASDKDARRLKRLLRNRVSAQQARERKKQYVTQLEEQAKNAQDGLHGLQAKVADLERQNNALRSIIKTMRSPAEALMTAAPLQNVANPPRPDADVFRHAAAGGSGGGQVQQQVQLNFPQQDALAQVRLGLPGALVGSMGLGAAGQVSDSGEAGGEVLVPSAPHQQGEADDGLLGAMGSRGGLNFDDEDDAVVPAL